MISVQLLTECDKHLQNITTTTRTLLDQEHTAHLHTAARLNSSDQLATAHRSRACLPVDINMAHGRTAVQQHIGHPLLHLQREDWLPDLASPALKGDQRS